MTPLTPSSLLLALAQAGHAFRVDGGRLVGPPPERLTPELREAVRANRAALVELLSAPEDWPPGPEWGADEWREATAAWHRRRALCVGRCLWCGLPTGRADYECCQVCRLRREGVPS